MKNMSKQLEEEKKRIASVTAPPELEGRLRAALQRKKKHSRFLSVRKIAIPLLLFLLVASSHYNALAYYGKKLFGFDEVIGRTLQDLNEQGLGQRIDKSVVSDDGTKLTIVGIMADSNRTILFYKLMNPAGLKEHPFDDFRPSKLTGFLTKARFENGSAKYNDDETELTGVMDFEPVSPFSKTLTLHYSQKHQDGKFMEKTISFPFNPNKAMRKEVTLKIKETVEVDRGTITFSTIKATPTMTVVEGSLRVDNFDRLPLPFNGIELIANGKAVERLGSEHRSSLTGRKFILRFDALPEQLHSLTLVLREFIGYRTVHEKIRLNDLDKKHVQIGGKDLYIEEVLSGSKGVHITIRTEESVLLDGVSIKIGEEIVPLETTIDHQTVKLEDGTLMNERTMIFDGNRLPDTLIIEGIHYMKPYNKRMEIPVN